MLQLLNNFCFTIGALTFSVQLRFANTSNQTLMHVYKYGKFIVQTVLISVSPTVTEILLNDLYLCRNIP